MIGVQCFRVEKTPHLTDLDRIGKMLLFVMIAFFWCYDVGEYVHRNIKEITVKPHGRKAKSIFRYGLDIVTEFLVRERNDRGILTPAFLSLDNPLINIPIHILEHIENQLLDAAIGMCCQIVIDGLHGDFGGQPVRETELARGDAAEGDAFETVLIGTSHNVTVTGG